MKKLLTAALTAMIVMPAFAQEQTKTAADMPASVKAEIKAHCAKVYPDDYHMQDYCLNQQTEGWLKVENF